MYDGGGRKMSFNRSAYYPDLSEELSWGSMQYERPLILAFNELMHTCSNISLLDGEAAEYILAELECQSASILLNIILVVRTIYILPSYT